MNMSERLFLQQLLISRDIAGPRQNQSCFHRDEKRFSRNPRPQDRPQEGRQRGCRRLPPWQLETSRTRRIELNDGSIQFGLPNTGAIATNFAKTELGEVVRPPRIELGLRVPETLVISLSLRARGKVLYHWAMIQSTFDRAGQGLIKVKDLSLRSR